MTPIQQQRLLGLGLLLLLISVVAFFLISSANENHQADIEDVSKEDESFASLIEPLDEGEAETETVLIEQEALVDPHKLEQVKSVPKTVEKQPVPQQKATDHEPIKTAVKSIDPVKKDLSKNTSLPSWTAQLASFTVKANADALAEKVKSQGYDVEILTSKSGNKTVYRVRLEAETNKASVEQKAARLKNSLKLSPQVLKVNK